MNKFFCDNNREEKKYLKAWLSKKDSWSTIQRYDLHIITASHICPIQEKKELSAKLRSKFREDARYIIHIDIHMEGSRPNNKFHDLLVFDCEEPCYTQKIY